MRQYREKTQNYFKEKVPKDRRDQVIFRLKKMIVEVQSHRDCMRYLPSYPQRTMLMPSHRSTSN